MKDDDVLALGDINVGTAREANEHIDQAMRQKEEKIEELQKQVSSLEDDRDKYKDQAEQAANLLEEIQNDKRQQLLARIQQANEAVAPDKEVNLEQLQQADVATLEQVADVLEVHAESASQPVQNQTNQPDLANVEGAEGAETLEDQLAATAESMGLGRSWNQLDDGGFSGPELADSQPDSDDPADRLAEAIRDISNSQVN